MARPKLLLVGVDQCDWKSWKNADCAAVYDPYGFDTGGVDVDVLGTPDFETGRFDGVVFAIPNYSKAIVPLICDALLAGLPTLVYKLRINAYEDMDAVRALPDGVKSNLWIGEHYQYQPGAIAARQAVAGGKIGAVEYVSLRCTLPMPERSPWMDAYGHLILEDLAYHHMTVLHSICGPLHGTVFAQSWSPSWLGRDKAYSALLLRADAGWRLAYDTRWGAAKAGDNFFGEWVLEGGKGQIFTDGDRAVFTGRNGVTEELASPCSPYVGWTGIVDHFGDVLSGRTQPGQPELLRFSRFDGILRLLYAAVDSAGQGKEITW